LIAAIERLLKSRATIEEDTAPVNEAAAPLAPAALSPAEADDYRRLKEEEEKREAAFCTAEILDITVERLPHLRDAATRELLEASGGMDCFVQYVDRMKALRKEVLRADIDAALRRLLPSLSDEERRQLRERIDYKTLNSLYDAIPAFQRVY
jgi:hypothetical protein